jgi:hypothetical protein
MLDEKTLRAWLDDLLAEIIVLPDEDSLDAEEPTGPAGSVCGPHAEPTCDVQVGLDVLRLLVKYLLFDLEATRRENRLLRTALNQRREGS